jgi:hypothetical protein
MPESTSNLSPRGLRNELNKYASENIIVFGAMAGVWISFFLPWVRFMDKSQTGLRLASTDYYWLWIIPITAIFVGSSWRNKKHFHIATASWAIVIWLCLFGFFAQVHTDWASGSFLAFLCALLIFVAGGENRATLPADAISNLSFHTQGDTSDGKNWVVHAPGFSVSSREFYNTLEATLRARNYPAVEFKRVVFSEGGEGGLLGMIERKREYFRIMRERMFFDLCAASYGPDSFFSCHSGEIPSVVTVRDLASLVAILFFIAWLLTHAFGLFPGALATLVLIGLAIFFLMNVLKLGMGSVDRALLKMPAIGAIYAARLRRDSYYRADTRLLFLNIINDLVNDEVERTVGANGVKLLTRHVRKSILDELYRTSVVQLDRTEKSK